MKTIKKITVSCIVIILALITAVSAFAVDWDYSGTGGATTTGGHKATGDFSVLSTGINCVVGLRLSVINSSGGLKTGTRPIDVFLARGATAYSSCNSITGVTYNGSSALTGLTNKTTYAGIVANNYSYSITNFGIIEDDRFLNNSGGFTAFPAHTLGTFPAAIKSWLETDTSSGTPSYANAYEVIAKCGSRKEDIVSNDRILAEPLFQVEIDGTSCCYTVAELALVHGIYSKSIDKAYKNILNPIYTDGSYGWIAWRIGNTFPAMVRLESSISGIDGLKAAPLITSGGYTLGTLGKVNEKISTNNPMLTPKETIINGYGVSVLTASTNNIAPPYTVKYYLNGVSNGVISTVTSTSNTTAKALPSVSGSTVNGWKLLDGDVVNVGSSISSNLISYDAADGRTDHTISLFATSTSTAWTATLTYNKNTTATVSNMPSSSSTQITGGYNSTTITISSSIPTRKGYTLWHWSESASDGYATLYHPSNSSAGDPSIRIKKSTPSVTLYAIWKPIDYTVRYNGNGGTLANPGYSETSTTYTSYHIYDKAKTLTSNRFAKTGYIFTGWATTASGSVAYLNNASVINLTDTQDAVIDLYAKWTPIQYNVAYNANGGTGTMALTVHTYDAYKNLTANGFTRTGYTFAGWNTKSDGTGTNYSNGQSVKNLSSTQGDTITLYAKWTPIKYYVRYNANGGTGATPTSTHIYDVSRTLIASEFSRTGYTFGGWATTSTSKTVAYTNSQSVKNLTTTLNATIDLYAIWNPITYQVKYNGNGSTSGSMSNSTHTYDVAKNLTANSYSRTGYTFAGWATSSGGAVKYGDGESVKNLSSTQGATVNLYAIWNPITYQVKYNGNGSTSGSMSNSTHTYDVAKNLTSNGYSRTGYAFAGWNTKTDGTGTNYTNGQSVKNLATTQGATVNLYAKWTPNSYTVHYYLDGSELTSFTQTCLYGTQYNYKYLQSKTGYHVYGWFNSATKPNPLSTATVNKTPGGTFSNLTSTAGGVINVYSYSTPALVNYVVKSYIEVLDGETYTYEQSYLGETKHFEEFSTQTLTAYSDSTISVTPTVAALDTFGLSHEFWVYDKYDVNGSAIGPFASVSTKIRPDGTTYVYFLYSLKEFTVIYDMNGGLYNGSSNSVTEKYKFGEEATFLTPTKAYYNFDGWHLSVNEDAGAGYIGGAGYKFKIIQDYYLYAAWSYANENDLAIVANSIRGNVVKESSMTASATVLNYAEHDITNENIVKATLTVKDSGGTIIDTDSTGFIVPRKSLTLVWVNIDIGDVEEGEVLTYEWTVEYLSSYTDNFLDNNHDSVTTTIKEYDPDSNTFVPDYQLDPDSEYEKSTVADDNSINRYYWDTWEYSAGTGFTIERHSSVPEENLMYESIFTPTNIGGLKKATTTGYQTRSGFAFGLDGKFAINDDVTSGFPHIIMAYPERNYSTEYQDYTALQVTEDTHDLSADTVYATNFPLIGRYDPTDVNDETYRHYTEMWQPDGKYTPVTYIAGVWTPVGEVNITVKQDSVDDILSPFIHANTLEIKGSLFDDFYTTHGRFYRQNEVVMNNDKYCYANFFVNGILRSSLQETYIIGENVALPNVLIDGYIVDGWYETADCTGSRYTNTSTLDEPDRVYNFYAKTSRITYAVEYYLNGVLYNSMECNWGQEYEYLPLPATASLGWLKMGTSDYEEVTDITFLYKPSTNGIVYKFYAITADCSYITNFYVNNELVKTVPCRYTDINTFPHVSLPGYIVTEEKWFTNAMLTGRYYEPDESYTRLTMLMGGIVDFYAEATEEIVYHLMFNANGGTGGMPGVVLHYTDPYTINCGFTRQNYTIQSWNTKADGTGTSYEKNATVSRLTTVHGSTVTLYAQWERIQYRLSYLGNLGTSIVSNLPATQIFNSGMSGTVSTVRPTYGSYHFLSWNTKANGTGIEYAPGQSIMLTANTALYAQWADASYSVKYYIDGVEHPELGQTCFTSLTYTYPTYSRTGYIFNGWYTNSACTAGKVTAGNTFKDLTMTEGAVINYYAKTTPITVKVDYYVTNPYSSTNRLFLYSKYYVYGQSYTTPTVPAVTGASISGWYAADNTYYGSGSTFTDSFVTNQTFTARYNGQNPVYFYYDDGSSVIMTRIVEASYNSGTNKDSITFPSLPSGSKSWWISPVTDEIFAASTTTTLTRGAGHNAIGTKYGIANKANAPCFFATNRIMSGAIAYDDQETGMPYQQASLTVKLPLLYNESVKTKGILTAATTSCEWKTSLSLSNGDMYFEYNGAAVSETYQTKNTFITVSIDCMQWYDNNVSNKFEHSLILKFRATVTRVWYMKNCKVSYSYVPNSIVDSWLA